MTPQFLGEQVADQTLALGRQHVERHRSNACQCLTLAGQQTHLRSVAVGDHQTVVGGQFRQCPCGISNVRALDGDFGRLTTVKQGVAANSDDQEWTVRCHRTLRQRSIHGARTSQRSG